jgi:hypothetical protein
VRPATGTGGYGYLPDYRHVRRTRPAPQTDQPGLPVGARYRADRQGQPATPLAGRPPLRQIRDTHRRARPRHRPDAPTMFATGPDLGAGPRRRRVRIPLNPYVGEEGVEGGAVAWLGGGRLRRVLGRDPESGLIMGGDREFHGKPSPGVRCMPGSRVGGPPTVMAWSVCGTAGHGCAEPAAWGSFWRRLPDSVSPALRSPVARRRRVLARGQQR